MVHLPQHKGVWFSNGIIPSTHWTLPHDMFAPSLCQSIWEKKLLLWKTNGKSFLDVYVFNTSFSSLLSSWNYVKIIYTLCCEDKFLKYKSVVTILKVEKILKHVSEERKIKWTRTQTIGQKKNFDPANLRSKYGIDNTHFVTFNNSFICNNRGKIG